MKKPPRTEIRLLLLLALLPSCAPHAHGAQERRTPRAGAKQTSRAARDAKGRERRERQQAAAAVNEAVASSAEVKDPYKRTLLLALGADALWSFDEQSARSLFARAWEAAVASDEEESKAKEGNDGGREAQGPGAEEWPEFTTRVTRARREVLSAASRRDALLTERYLAELRESIEKRQSRFGQEGSDDEATERRYDARDYSAPESDDEHLRLDLSRSLAEEGDYGQAAEVAAREVAGGVSAALIRFLIGFRRKAPAEADALYRQLLSATARDPRAGANDVLLLSSYALTPSMLTTVNARGGISLGYVNGEGGVGAGEPPPPPPPAVRRDFLNAAAAVLLRAGAQGSAGSAGWRERAAALFYASARLLPFFESEAPQAAPQLHALRQSLASELSEQSRDSLSRVAGVTGASRSNPSDPLARDFEYAKTGAVAAARDAARQRALRRAVELKLWARAREAIAGMEDAELRADSLSLLAVCQVAAVGEAFEGDEGGDERAAQFVEQADVPPLTRALGYARAALLASRRKRQARAAELLERARAYAEQTDGGREARFVALLVVATAAEQADPAQAWPLLPALVRAANEAGDAPADELAGGFRVPNLGAAENVGLAEQLADYRLDELFAALARHDLQRALREARPLSDVTTRSLVTLSAARARLAGAGRAGLLRRGAK